MRFLSCHLITWNTDSLLITSISSTESLLVVKREQVWQNSLSGKYITLLNTSPSIKHHFLDTIADDTTSNYIEKCHLCFNRWVRARSEYLTSKMQICLLYHLHLIKTNWQDPLLAQTTTERLVRAASQRESMS